MKAEEAPGKQPGKLRIVQLVVVLSGIVFVAAGVLIALLGGAADTTVLVLAAALIAVGFGDIIVAFFVFRRASEMNIRRPGDLDSRE